MAASVAGKTDGPHPTILEELTPAPGRVRSPSPPQPRPAAPRRTPPAGSLLPHIPPGKGGSDGSEEQVASGFLPAELLQALKQPRWRGAGEGKEIALSPRAGDAKAPSTITRRPRKDGEVRVNCTQGFSLSLSLFFSLSKCNVGI